MPDETCALLEGKRLVHDDLYLILIRIAGFLAVDYLEHVLFLAILGRPLDIALDGERALIPFPVVLHQVIDHAKMQILLSKQLYGL